MKVNINQIPSEGKLALEEEVEPVVWDLDMDSVKFTGPIKVTADISRITNAVTADFILNGSLSLPCSRCLKEIVVDFKKNIRLNYEVNKLIKEIDFTPQLREEIIVSYPIKSLCSPNCNGLCPKCGKNLNEGGCSCGITEKKTF